MEEEATQPSTQFPGASLEDLEMFKNVLCLLIPESSAAKSIVRLLYQKGAYSVLACTINNDAPFRTTPSEQEFANAEEKAAAQGIELDHLAIALRVPQDGNIPANGFTFGRDFRKCHVCLGGSIKLSNKHFCINVQPKSGALVLKDMSMNGTTVDGVKLRGKSGKDVCTRTLQNGSRIELFENDPRDHISFNVRLLAEFSIASDYSTFTAGQPAATNNAGRSLFPSAALLRKDVQYFGKDNEYQSIEYIGSGSFATVWKAVHRTTGNIVAVKQIKKHKASVNREAIKKEVTIMERINHPNVVKYHSYNEDEMHMNICLELIEYGDLRDFLNKRGKLSESQVQEVSKQMLEAVQYLHKEGITHRDLKPENILVSSPQPITVKITDFGLAKLITNDQSFLKTFCGTMLYLAPEAFPAHMQPQPLNENVGSKRKRPAHDDPVDRKRIAKHNIYGQSVDIWAIGCIIYMLMTNIHPFELGEKDDILTRVHAGKFDVELLRRNSASPAECSDFISRLIKLNPALRIHEDEALKHPWLKKVTGSQSDDMYDLAELSQGLRIPSDGVPEELDEDLEDEDEYISDSDDAFIKSETTVMPAKDSFDDNFSDEMLGDSFDFASFERVEKQAEALLSGNPDKMLVNFGGSSELLPSHLNLPSTGSGSIFVTPDSGPSANRSTQTKASIKSDTQMKSVAASEDSDHSEPDISESIARVADNLSDSEQSNDESVASEADSMDYETKSIGLCLSTGENLGHSGLPSMPHIPADISSEDSAEVVEQSSTERELLALKKWAEDRPSQSERLSQSPPDFPRTPPPVAWGRIIPLPGATEGKVVNCTGPMILFGRHDKADVQFGESRMSRRHAAITITDPTQRHSGPPTISENILAYVAVRSSNPVYLNGEALPQHVSCRIFHGDQLIFLDQNNAFIGYSVELRIGQHERPVGAPNIIPLPSRSPTPSRGHGSSSRATSVVSLATTV